MLRIVTLVLSLLLLQNTLIQAHCPEDIQLWLNPDGHTATIGKLMVTPQGQLVTASHDKTIRVWDVAQGQLRESCKILGQLWAGSEDLPISRVRFSLFLGASWQIKHRENPNTSPAD